VKAFWRNAIEPSATALGTCSSLGTLPVTLRAGKAMGINPEIVDVSIPLLVNLNKGGVAMIAALKIVFIYSVLGMEFTTETFFLTMLIAVLSAIIVGGVPGGAFLGEIFIVTTLGLPMEAIPMLVVLGTITDAPATLINVIHDLNAAQIVERFAGKKQTNTEINSTAVV
jgi:Na+/H+-dicarboxylate symporter